MKTAKARKAPARPTAPGESRGATILRSLDTERAKLIDSIEPPALTLDDIVISAKHTPVGKEKLLLTGAELAHVLSLRERYNNVSHMADDGDVNLRLRGLSDLIRGHTPNCELTSEAAYFLAYVLDDLAAKLEADNRVDAFSMFLKKGVDRKAGAA